MDSDILNFAIENGIVDITTIQEQVAEMKIKKYVSMHNHKIWQGKDGYWCTYITTENGRKFVKKKTEQEIKVLIADLYGAMINPTVETCYNEWIKNKIEYGEITIATKNRYKIDYDRFVKEPFGEKSIADIDSKTLEKFVRETIADNQLTAKAYGNLRTVIKGIWKYALNNNFTNLSISTFFADLDISKKAFAKKKQKTQVFTTDETDEIINYLWENPIIENLAIILCFQTGMRIGEVSALTYMDIEDNYINVNKQEVTYKGDENSHKYVYEVVDYAKTDAGTRKIYITDSVHKTIEAIKRRNHNGKYLLEKNGKKIHKTVLGGYINKVCDDLGIERRSMHKIRKTYATLLLDAGCDEAFVVSQMGHSDIKVTRDYYYFTNKRENDYISQINKAIDF